jgi:hypothetical protein
MAAVANLILRVSVPSLEIGCRQIDRNLIAGRFVTTSSDSHGFDTIPEAKELFVPLVPHRIEDALNGVEHTRADRKFDNCIAVTH